MMFDQKDFDTVFAVCVICGLLCVLAWQLWKLRQEHAQLIYAWCARCGKPIRRGEKFNRILDEADPEHGAAVCQDCLIIEKDGEPW